MAKERLAPFVHSGIYLKEVPGKGRGVFCSEGLKTNDIIEITSVIVFNEEDTVHACKTILLHYVVAGEMLTKAMCSVLGIKDPKKVICLPMGVTSLCNHLVEPNAVREEHEQEGIIYCTLRALKDIPKDTEISINYGMMWLASRAGFWTKKKNPA